jgi:Nucleotidyl transferase AbiEii toxin, Type IV TA system
VIGQMLPPGVVKGGTAIKLRVGEHASRFTLDFDAARDGDVELDEYLDQLADTLAAGWNGFTGTVEELEPAQPEGIPEEYVMQPFLIRLAYRGRHWLSVTFELGRDEIGSTENHDARIASDLVDLFEKLALPEPSPVPLLVLDHQIAQKLHACTSQPRAQSRTDQRPLKRWINLIWFGQSPGLVSV